MSRFIVKRPAELIDNRIMDYAVKYTLMLHKQNDKPIIYPLIGSTYLYFSL